MVWVFHKIVYRIFIFYLLFTIIYLKCGLW